MSFTEKTLNQDVITVISEYVGLRCSSCWQLICVTNESCINNGYYYCNEKCFYCVFE